MSMDRVIAVIRRSETDEVRVGFSEHSGELGLDIRLYVEIPDTKEQVPSKVGITLKPEELRAVAAALRKAQAETRSSGFLTLC